MTVVTQGYRCDIIAKSYTPVNMTHAHPHPRATSQTSKGFLRFQEEQLEKTWSTESRPRSIV